MRQLLLIVIVLLIIPNHPARAADPPCVPSIKNLFSRGLCAETVVPADLNVERLESHGIASISGLAFGSDGSLYFARPATSEIIRLVPDGKGRFLPPQVFAAKLPEPPNGLAYDAAERAWYVSADTTITRLRDGDGDGIADVQQVIVRDLPGGNGGWLGNIRIGPDRRLYVVKASRCDTCTDSDPRRGALLSLAPDGSDMRIVVRGLRDAYDFDWNPADSKLYIADNEPPALPAELNALPDQIPPVGVDFGWPHCDSRGQPLRSDNPNPCANTISPLQVFDPGSHPTGLTFYRGDAFPDLRGKLLVLLSGSWNTPTISGYEMMLAPFADSKPGPPQRFLPNTGRVTSDAAQGMTSFYPYHMTAIAISPEPGRMDLRVDC
jgi:glucose/arabinose dehydrogenase